MRSYDVYITLLVLNIFRYIFLILGSFAAVTIFYQIPKENETGFGKNVMV